MPKYQQLIPVRFCQYTTAERDATWPDPPNGLVIHNTTTDQVEIYLEETWQAYVPDPDAGDITYTPTVLTDWDGDADPGDLDDALDELAERVDDNEILIAAHGPSQHTEYANWKLIYTDGSGDQQELALGADGYVLRGQGASAAPHFDMDTLRLLIHIDGGGSAIGIGVKCYIPDMPACVIQGWSLIADQSGSIVIDVWKDTWSNAPPTVADTIAGSEKPTLSSAQKNADLTLTTWTTAVTAGDVLAFNVDSCSTCTWVDLVIRARKT